MKPRKSTYLVHRWIGLIVSLQLLAWSTGGFVFSILSIEAVRGERDVAAPVFESLSSESIEVLPAEITRALADGRTAGQPIGCVALVDRGLGPVWEIRTTEDLFLESIGVSGDRTPRGLLSQQEATRLAARDFAPRAPIASVQLIEADPPIEYRRKPLPAYRVAFEHPKSPHIYIDARSGEVMARRNRQWRVFDFFWMLHTMDYGGRDDFNHPLLTVFSLLALASSLSGISLWVWRAHSRLRSRTSQTQLAQEQGRA